MSRGRGDTPSSILYGDTPARTSELPKAEQLAYKKPSQFAELMLNFYGPQLFKLACDEWWKQHSASEYDIDFSSSESNEEGIVVTGEFYDSEEASYCFSQEWHQSIEQLLALELHNQDLDFQSLCQKELTNKA